MVEGISYSDNVDQLELLIKEGPLGVKCEKYSFIKRPWYEKAALIVSLGLSILTDSQKDELKKVYSLAGIKAQMLAAANRDIKFDSAYFDEYFKAEKMIKLWNDYQGGWQEKLIERCHIITSLPKIEYTGSVVVESEKYGDLFTFSYCNKNRIPLVITSKNSDLTFTKFRQLIEKDQAFFQKVFDLHKAFLFRNFDVNEEIESPLKSIFGALIAPRLLASKDVLLEDKNYHDLLFVDQVPSKIDLNLRVKMLVIGIAFLASVFMTTHN